MRSLAKYRLEFAVGALALILLLTGLIVSLSERTPRSAVTAAPDAGTVTTALAVLPERPVFALDTINGKSPKQVSGDGRGGSIIIAEGQTLRFVGWAVDRVEKTAPAAAFIQVDEFARAQALLSNRPDVAAFFKDASYDHSGFDLTLPAALLTPGTHRLAFLVENSSRTGYYVAPDWLSVTVRPPAFALPTRPLEGATAYSLDKFGTPDGRSFGTAPNSTTGALSAGSPVLLEGWAVDSGHGSLARGVAAVVDDRQAIQGAYGVARTDVAAALGNPALTQSGFIIQIPAAMLPKGAHEISLRIYASDGSGYYFVKNRARLTVE